MALINEDHSLAPLLDELAPRPHLGRAGATDPRRHMLRSAVTGDEIELVDLSHEATSLLPGDHVMLASDGIHTLDEARSLASSLPTGRTARSDRRGPRAQRREHARSLSGQLHRRRRPHRCTMMPVPDRRIGERPAGTIELGWPGRRSALAIAKLLPAHDPHPPGLLPKLPARNSDADAHPLCPRR